MDLYQLRVLRELGDRGSVAATAAALRVSPPAVSQVIASLQRGFQVPLTQRRGRIVELTDAGRALAVASADVATAMARAEAAVDAFLGDATRSVRICAFHSAAVTFFPPLTAHAQSPGFPRLECIDEDVDKESFPTLTADYDIVIGHRMTHTDPWPDDYLAVLPLLQEPMDVAVHKSHPLASQPVITPADLVGATWVSTHPGFSPADMLDAVASAAGTPMHVVHRINDFVTAAAIVAQGEHIALLPRHTVQLDATPGVVLRPLAGMHTQRRVDLLIRRERSVHKAVTIVAQTLQHIAASIVADSTHRPTGVQQSAT